MEISPVKTTPVVDGMDYSYLMIPKRDTLHTFNPGMDSFKVTMQFEKVSTGYPVAGCGNGNR